MRWNVTDVQLTCEIRWNKMVIQIDWISKHLYSCTEDNLIKLINSFFFRRCIVLAKWKTELNFSKVKKEFRVSAKIYRFVLFKTRNTSKKNHRIIRIPIRQLPSRVREFTEHSLKIIDMVECVVDTFAKNGEGHGIKRHGNSNETTRLSRASAIKIRFPRQPFDQRGPERIRYCFRVGRARSASILKRRANCFEISTRREREREREKESTFRKYRLTYPKDGLTKE